jgi:hypothetical protein
MSGSRFWIKDVQVATSATLMFDLQWFVQVNITQCCFAVMVRLLHAEANTMENATSRA